MDKKPFLKIDLLNLNESEVKELSKLTKSAFDVSDVISSASELKYVGGIKSLLRQQLKTPDGEFAIYFFRNLCPENAYTGRLKKEFLGYTLRGIKEFITEEMKNLLDDAVNPPEVDIKDDSENLHTGKQTEFTEDERDGFYILRGILSSVVKPSRITYRDTQNYCNILLDNNGSRQIVRLHFNNPKNRKLEIYSIDINGDKSSEKVSIVELDEIYQYADRFKAIVSAYEQKTVVK